MAYIGVSLVLIFLLMRAESKPPFTDKNQGGVLHDVDTVDNADFFSGSDDRNKYLWKAPGAVRAFVPYYCDDTVGQAYCKSDVQPAAEHIANHSCIDFRDITADVKLNSSILNSTEYVDHVRITQSNDGCRVFFVGKKGKEQVMQLDKAYHCAIHEFLHVLGLDHEQCRPDRDRYITISEKWARESGCLSPLDRPEYRFTPYDYASELHYFPIEKHLEVKEKPFLRFVKLHQSMTVKDVGNRDKKLSLLDIIKVNKLYKCYEERQYCGDYTAHKGLCSLIDDWQKRCIHEGSCLEDDYSSYPCFEQSIRSRCGRECGACICKMQNLEGFC